MSAAAKTLIIFGILVGVLGGVVVYFRMTLQQDKGINQNSSNPTTLASTGPITQVQTSTDVSQYDLIRDTYLKILEASISAVNKRIDELAKKQGVTVTSTTTSPIISVSPSPASQIKTLYIPLGYGGSSTATTDFASIGATELSINPSDYPGYKQMVFEANMRIFQGNGTGEARLFNKTDGTAVLSSIVSTTSQDYATKTSSGFSLPAGAKTYVVQLKSSTGYSVDLQLTRLRIDF